jgi:mono/diheme cytochrome c family protein
MGKHISLLLLGVLISSLVSCDKQLPAEEEATLKKINTVKRGKVSDAEWARIYAGKNVYETYCSGCHGLKGDGKGPAASMLIVKPRNFVKAMYKFISTPKNSLPTDADLQRTLLRGIPRSSMPHWKFLSEDDRSNVIAYIKTFSEKWQNSQTQRSIAFPSAPEWVGSASSASLGKAIYTKMGCANCHGEKGLADGPSSNTLKDAEGNPIPAFKFTDGVLKGGNTIEDIYRTFYTGLAGTPMPAYGGILSDDDNWHLVSYVLYLMGKTNISEAGLSSPAGVIDTAKALSTK